MNFVLYVHIRAKIFFYFASIFYTFLIIDLEIPVYQQFYQWWLLYMLFWNVTGGNFGDRRKDDSNRKDLEWCSCGTFLGTVPAFIYLETVPAFIYLERPRKPAANLTDKPSTFQMQSGILNIHALTLHFSHRVWVSVFFIILGINMNYSAKQH
jgi:hypothetical protein